MPEPRHNSFGNGSDVVAAQNGADDAIHSAGLVEHAPRIHPRNVLSGQIPDCPEGARIIPLTLGMFAIVDESDYERVAAIKWFAKPSRNGVVYAVHRERRGPQKTLYMHRFILGVPSGVLVDHANRCGLDNRRTNIRPCTPGENVRNAIYPRTKNGRLTSSAYRGVSFYSPSRQWLARIQIDRKTIRLGKFASEIEAAKAYDRAAKLWFGAFARLNFPDESYVPHATDDACGSDEWLRSGRVAGLPRW